jgi:hypothetical protein
MTMFKAVAFVLLLAVADGARAESFAVNLGNRTLGNVTFQHNGDVLQLSSLLNNTPLGVFDGRFDATSRLVRTDAGDVRRQFLGISDTSRKQHQVSVLMDDGVVTEVTISPVSEYTALSVPDQVPAGLLDPLRAFRQLISVQDCPALVQMYDGRRVIHLTTINAIQTQMGLQCDMAYKVIAGPGHLSPIGFKSASVSLMYDGASKKLSTMQIAAGPFSVQIVRTD